MALFHPADLDLVGWLFLGLIFLVMIVLAIALVVGFVYLLYFLAKKNGERINRKKELRNYKGALITLDTDRGR